MKLEPINIYIICFSITSAFLACVAGGLFARSSSGGAAKGIAANGMVDEREWFCSSRTPSYVLSMDRR